MKKPKIEVEECGLCIFAYLPGTATLMVEYQACTHGGWAKYLNGSLHTENFDSRSECLRDLERTYELVEAA